MIRRNLEILGSTYKVLVDGIAENELNVQQLAELLQIGIDARESDHVGRFSTLLDGFTKATYNLVKKSIVIEIRCNNPSF
nr:hypothetical protein [Candidatus Sigynarchaeota archaeon]